MKWVIRQQIMVPIVLIQTVTVAAITYAAVALAERRAEREIVARLEGVIEVLGSSNFPLTGATLARMHGLSGARFIAYGARGDPLAASEPALLEQAPRLASIPLGSQGAIPNLRELSSLQIQGTEQLAALVSRRAAGPGDAESLLVLYPESSWREARRGAAQVPLLVGTGALLVMAVATSWIAHRISRRIRRLEHQVARIAEGDFQELDLGRGGQRDEVHDLSRSINSMCAQLRQMSQAIRRSERTHLVAQLAAGLAHQLRNGLTGARMSMQLHARRCAQARADASVEVALRQLTLIEEQVRGLLALGREEPRSMEETDLVRLLSDVAALLQAACAHGRVDLELNVPRAPALIVADASGLRAAVLNLALNAIEAAGSGGRVELALREDGGAWTLQVCDSGPGPPPELAETLFDPFVTGKPEGVGLGLALARHVAEAHDGTLSLKRDGGRTCFRLTLPPARRDREQDEHYEPSAGHR